MEELAFGFGQVSEGAMTSVFDAATKPVVSMEWVDQSGVFASKPFNSSPILIHLKYHPLSRTRLVQVHAELRAITIASPA